jgi:hypothetical protein
MTVPVQFHDLVGRDSLPVVRPFVDLAACDIERCLGIVPVENRAPTSAALSGKSSKVKLTIGRALRRLNGVVQK